MYSEMGAFALKQVVSSMVVVGPLLIIIAAFNFVFNQSRKAVLIYLTLGLILTAVGAVNLYRQFSLQAEQATQQGAPASPEASGDSGVHGTGGK